jgi:hypothetical protein
MDGRASRAAMTLDGSYQRHLEASVVTGLRKGHLAGSHMLGCNLVNAPAARIGEGRHMAPYLEAARMSSDLEEVAAVFACCAEAVAEMVGCQVHRMNIALQNDSHLVEQLCCTVLA